MCDMTHGVARGEGAVLRGELQLDFVHLGGVCEDVGELSVNCGWGLSAVGFQPRQCNISVGNPQHEVADSATYLTFVQSLGKGRHLGASSLEAQRFRQTLRGARFQRRRWRRAGMRGFAATLL